jgi:hypothetical protein
MPGMSPAISNLQNDAFASLNRLKQDQRSVANYAALTYGGIVAGSQIAGGQINSYLLEMLLFGVFALASAMVWRMQSGMTSYRRKLYIIYNHYYDEEEKTLLKLPLAPKRQFYDPIFLGIIGVTLLGGMILSMLIV